MNEVKPPRTVITIVLLVALIAIVLVGIALAGGGDDETTSSPAPTEAPSGDAPPPSAAALPPGIAECLADQGFDLESPDDLHSAVPQDVLDACFDALHQGGGAP